MDSFLRQPRKFWTVSEEEYLERITDSRIEKRKEG